MTVVLRPLTALTALTAACAFALAGCTSGSEPPHPAPSPTADAPTLVAAASSAAVTAPLASGPDGVALAEVRLALAGEVVAVVGGRSVQAVGRDGRVRWTTTLPGMAAGAPVATGAAVAVLARDAKERRNVLVVLDAGSGAVTARVPVSGSRFGLAAAADRFVTVVDGAGPGSSFAAAYSAKGQRLWRTPVPERTSAVVAGAGTVALVTRPRYAIDSTVTAPGRVHLLDPDTGTIRGAVTVDPSVDDYPPVADGRHWWLPVGTQSWARYDGAARRVGTPVTAAVTGGAGTAFMWRSGWAAGAAPAVRVGRPAQVAAAADGVTVWSDPTSPYPLVVTGDRDGAVRGYLAAPTGHQLGTRAVVDGDQVVTLTCTPVKAGSPVCASIDLARFPLPRR